MLLHTHKKNLILKMLIKIYITYIIHIAFFIIHLVIIIHFITITNYTFSKKNGLIIIIANNLLIYDL